MVFCLDFMQSVQLYCSLLMCHETLLVGIVLHLIMKMVITNVIFWTPNFIYDSSLHEEAAEMTSIPTKSIWQQPQISCLIYGQLYVTKYVSLIWEVQQ